MNHKFRTTRIEHYEQFIGAQALDRIERKARRLAGVHVVNISSTFYGGGVAELLSSLTLLQHSLGVRADWRLIQGSPEFFSVTKKIHNALQGAQINLSGLKKDVYEGVICQNALRMDLDEQLVVVHDPQPLPLVRHFRHRSPWIWRCHVDLSRPDPQVWDYVREFIEEYDATILSLPEYARELSIPQLFFMPAIDPFAPKNRELTDAEIDDRMTHYGIPTDLPIVVQVSRFDRWKDPMGVIEAFRMARREVDATLVLLGNVATDDPEGQAVFESLLASKEERIVILTAEDSTLVNALQRRATVVVQKSLREGFGLTVTEAMWKGAAVIGGRCGGISRQIEDGVSGFLVSSIAETAERMLMLLRDADLRRRLGEAARASVAAQFLMPRLTEQYLDLYASFEPHFTPHRRRG
jgi:trehalose synthase